MAGNLHLPKLTRQQAVAVQLMVDGKTLDEIAVVIFDCRDENGLTDPKKIASAKTKLGKWRASTAVQTAYKNLLMDAVRPFVGRAIQRLCAQLDSENDWIVNKSANDLLTRFAPLALGTDDKTIHVVIDGGPTLGVPVLDE